MTRSQSDVGFVVVADTAAVTSGDYYGYLALTDTVIAAITFQAGYHGDAALVGKTIPAGMYRPMQFHTLTLTSGSGTCERAS